MSILRHDHEEATEPSQTEQMSTREVIARLKRTLRTGLTHADQERLDWYEELDVYGLDDYCEDQYAL